MLSMLKNTRAVRFAKGRDHKDRSAESQTDENRFNLDHESVNTGPENEHKRPVSASSSLQAASVRNWPRRILEWAMVGLLRSWQRSTARPARLAVIERISLGPKQSLVLVEADGVRLLVATSGEAASAFFPLSSPASVASIENGAALSPSVPSGVAPTDSSINPHTGSPGRPDNRAFRRSASESPSGLWLESRISW